MSSLLIPTDTYELVQQGNSYLVNRYEWHETESYRVTYSCFMTKRPGRPRWQLLSDDLRQQVSSGAYAAGDQLPSKTSLAEQWEVSVNTVERALSELRDEGLVETFHGLGSFVRATPEPETAGGGELEDLRDRVARLEAQMEERVARLETQMEEVYSNLSLEHSSASDASTQAAG